MKQSLQKTPSHVKRLRRMHALLSALCLAQPLAAQSLSFTDRHVHGTDPLRQNGAPLVLNVERLLFDTNARIQRDLVILGPLLLDVSQHRSVELHGDIDVDPSPLGNSVYKFGQGSVSLSGSNIFYGGIVVAEGSVRIDNADAVSKGTPQFVMLPGTRLELADGLRFNNSILMMAALQNAIDSVPHQALSTASGTNDLNLYIPQGTVYHTGSIHIDADYVLNKTGPGTLQFEGHQGGDSILGEFHVREGTLSVPNRSSGHITVHNGATIKSSGFVFNLRLNDGARLETISPIDTFTVWSSLRMAPKSVAHIWLNNHQANPPLVFQNDAQLDGILLVSLSPDFDHSYPYVVVLAPNGYQGQFAELVFSNPQGDMPTLHYYPTEIHLAYSNDPNTGTPPPRRQPARLNTGAGAYNQIAATQLADSRFLREAVAGYLWDNNAATKSAQYITQHTAHKGLWARAFHADLHQKSHSSAWQQQRRTEGLLIGFDSGQRYGLRYGAQLGLQQSRWNSPTANAQAQWNSYTLGATIASPHDAPLAWHLGMGYSQLRTQHQRQAIGTAISNKHSQQLWQLYAEARPMLYTHHHDSSSHWQRPTTQFYGIGQLVQLHRPATHSRENWMHQGALSLKHNAVNATVLGLGLGLSHHYASQHGNTTLNLRLLRQQAVAGTTLRTDYNNVAHLLQGDRLSATHALNAWQLDLNVRGELTKNSYLGIDLSQRYERKRMDHTINLNAEIVF